MRLLPLKTDEKKPANDEKKTTATMSTRYRIVNENSDGVSLIDVSLEAANVHQVKFILDLFVFSKICAIFLDSISSRIWHKLSARWRVEI